MRNSSDIFCLKEPRTGENDGSQLFSINGSCYSKINRRRQASSSAFQYGSLQPEYPEEKNNGLAEPPAPTSTSEEAKLPDEEEVVGDEETGDQENLGAEEAPEEADGDKIRKIADKEQKQRVFSSNMKRNPLTGDGVEDDETASTRRRAQRKASKWLW